MRLLRSLPFLLALLSNNSLAAPLGPASSHLINSRTFRGSEPTVSEVKKNGRNELECDIFFHHWNEDTISQVKGRLESYGEVNQLGFPPRDVRLTLILNQTPSSKSSPVPKTTIEETVKHVYETTKTQPALPKVDIETIEDTVSPRVTYVIGKKSFSSEQVAALEKQLKDYPDSYVYDVEEKGLPVIKAMMPITLTKEGLEGIISKIQKSAT